MTIDSKMNWKTHADKKRAKMIRFGAIRAILALSKKNRPRLVCAD